MNKAGLWLCLLAASLSPVSAQITVEVLQDQDQFLPGEALPVAVRITNRSGQPLHIGGDENWLTFGMESKAGSVVRKTGETPVPRDVTLVASSKRATIRVDLAPYFALNQPGRYLVTATVRIPDWPREIPPSLPKGFDVVDGAKLWEQEFGVPPTPDATSVIPEVRKYILEQANYLKAQVRLYLRVTDGSGSKTFRVFPIGSLLGFSRPEFQVDKLSRLHCLYENGPQSFSYTVFNPDGDLLVRQTYAFKTTRARLKLDAEGNISVAGGSRRITASDVPAAEPADLTDGIKLPKP